MSQHFPVLILTGRSSAAITKKRFVTLGSSNNGAPIVTQTTAGANAIGVADYGATAAGEDIPVITMGTAMVESGAAVAVGALVEANASGQAITRTSGAILGRSLEAATASGQLIEVHLIPN